MSRTSCCALATAERVLLCWEEKAAAGVRDTLVMVMMLDSLANTKKMKTRHNQAGPPCEPHVYFTPHPQRCGCYRCPSVRALELVGYTCSFPQLQTKPAVF